MSADLDVNALIHQALAPDAEHFLQSALRSKDAVIQSLKALIVTKDRVIALQADRIVELEGRGNTHG